MAKNVFHIVSDKVWGGIEQYVYDLAAATRARGYYVELLARNRRVVLDRLRDLEVPISILPLKGLPDIESPMRFARQIRRGRNIIHVHNVKDAATAVLARHISENQNTRIVMTCHSVARPKRGILYKTIYQELDKIIFVSDVARRAFLEARSGIDPSCVTVIHDSAIRCENPVLPVIDIRKQYNISPAKRLIMFHGHITREKGVSALLRALTQLDKSRWHLVIMGYGEPKYLSEIKAFIVANQLLGNVTFIGYQREVQPLLSQCDFGVLPSITPEAFGLTNIEYMMLGKAHIATNNGAQREYVEDGVSGLLVPPDDYRELASAIERLMADPSLCSSLGSAARRKFDDDLSYDHFTTRIFDCYESLFK